MKPPQHRRPPQPRVTAGGVEGAGGGADRVEVGAGREGAEDAQQQAVGEDGKGAQVGGAAAGGGPGQQRIAIGLDVPKGVGGEEGRGEDPKGGRRRRRH